MRHLRYFIAVAEELHFGHAAKRLNIAQPPLSLQIRRLEEMVGAQLLFRTKRRVELTDAGRIFLDEARQIMDHVDRAVLAAQRAGRGETGKLVIGFVNAATFSILPDILQAFRTRFPDVAVTLHELSTERQVESLRSGSIDVGFLRPPIDGDVLSLLPVLREALVMALEEHHSLAAHAAPSLRLFAREPFILFPRRLGPGLYDQIIRLCQRSGFTPHVVQETDQMQTIVSLVAAGIGVALVPASLQNLRRTGVVYRTVPESRPIVEVAVAWRGDMFSTNLRTFLNVVKERCTARRSITLCDPTKITPRTSRDC